MLIIEFCLAEGLLIFYNYKKEVRQVQKYKSAKAKYKSRFSNENNHFG